MIKAGPLGFGRRRHDLVAMHVDPTSCRNQLTSIGGAASRLRTASRPV